jgi:beta-N-acetylhexosaminidase
LGCGKHFPGLGEARLDTHKELPSVRKSLALMRAQDLAPYRELRREMPFVMVAHAAYPEVTGDRAPASLSAKWMQGILREQIGYKGLIISDDLEMGGVLAAGPIEDVAVGTLRAGADIFLVCQSEAQVWRAYEAVLREAERDRRFAKLVARAAQRVLKFKRGSRELRAVKAPPTDRQIASLRIAMDKFARRVAREGRA